MLPLRIDSPARGLPFVTCTLMVLCIAAVAARFDLGPLATGFVPVRLLEALFHPTDHLLTMALSLIVSFFLHAGIIHLVSNLWFLWLFGSAVEQILGHWKFFWTYMLCGLIASIVQALSDPFSIVPMVGASGAIAGIMGVQFVKRPFARMFVWIPPLFFVYFPAVLFLAVWLYCQYLGLQSTSRPGGVAWWAHIGGFATGVILGRCSGSAGKKGVDRS